MVATWVLSLFRETIFTLIQTGPIESLIRIMTNAGEGVDIELSPVPKFIMEKLDFTFLFSVRKLAANLPNYTEFNTTNHVAYGFDITMDMLARHGALAAATFITVTLIGYFVLKTRELAA